MKDILIYGAYGYTGKLIVKEAIAKGLKPIVAGRDESKTKDLAAENNLEYRVLDLHDVDALRKALEKISLVIHAAGPFSSTAMPMVEACIQSQTHYIDITGEYQVFEHIATKDQIAKNAGVMLLPGAGFDVVPSDCLAKHIFNKLSDATHLELAFAGLGGGVSRGTAKTMIEGSSEGQKLRAAGKLKNVKLGSHVKTIDYGNQKMLSVGISWGDIVTAYHSTGIPNIEVYTGTNKKQLKQMQFMSKLQWLLKAGFVKNFLKKKIDKRNPGPSAEKREASVTYLYGKAWNEQEAVEARLVTPNGYSLTAKSAVLIAQKILSDNLKPGFQTPSTAYGEKLILEIPDCRFI